MTSRIIATNMAASGTVYQQMVVPAPYHYHQSQHSVLSQNAQQSPVSVSKKESKRRKKHPLDAKLSATSKKNHNSNTSPACNGFLNGGQNSNRSITKVDCSRCSSRRKCYKHLNQKCRGSISTLSCKTPEQTVLQLKRHMLKLVSGEPGAVCKSDPRTGVLTLDLNKMYNLYLQEHEPLAMHSNTSELNSSYKPVVKQWLYRKILLDEFRGLDFLCCKRHLAELKRALEEAAVSEVLGSSTSKKKKTKIKPQIPSGPDYSYGGADDRGAAVVGLSTLQHSTPISSSHTLHHSPASHHTSPHYQLPASHLMSVGGVNCSPMTAVTPATPPLQHSSLTPYITSQVTPNILFGLGTQQQHTAGGLQSNVTPLQPHSGGQTNGSITALQPLPPSNPHPHPLSHQPPPVGSPTQQQPLNLQTSQQQQQHQHQHQVINNSSSTSSSIDNSSTAVSLSSGLQQGGGGLPLSLSHSIASSSATGTIPLNLHNPYYVSLSPMLPLHMTSPATQHTPPHHHHHHHVPHHHPAAHHHHHHHAQQFQHNMVAQHPQAIAGTAVAAFNHHAMYQ